MNIIICGAGRVGFTIAKLLSEQGHSITVIDQSSEDIQKKLMKDLEGAKSANCQVTSNGQKMIRKNIKYLDELRKEIK